MNFLNLFRTKLVPGAIWLSTSQGNNGAARDGREYVKIESVKDGWVLYSGISNGQTMSVPRFRKYYTKTTTIFRDPVQGESWCFRWAEENLDPFKRDFRSYTITNVESDLVTCDDGTHREDCGHSMTVMKFHNTYCRPKVDSQIHASSERPDPFRIQNHGPP